MPALLSDAAVAARLKHLGGWRKEGKFIVKTFEFKKFMDGIAFVDSVAKIAEKEEHHPDINVRYTAVKLSLQTHSEGGVTEWDFGLAERIERCLGKGRRAPSPR
ncbi:MAG: 4a-hydroxytetrahydrobiopterin dehydratase [Thaumarchaeota archaeon]|nr:4a-hydroxytetrahydrobiopterin dehydratase [Nitrososphaerota archaeon]